MNSTNEGASAPTLNAAQENQAKPDAAPPIPGSADVINVTVPTAKGTNKSSKLEPKPSPKPADEPKKDDETKDAILATHVPAYQKGQDGKWAYTDGLLTLADEMEKQFRATQAPTKAIAEIEADAQRKCAPHRKTQVTIMWVMARIVARMRKNFEFRKVSKGKAVPGSWPHFCRTDLAKRGLATDEKDASRQRRAIEYIEKHHKDVAALLEKPEPAKPLPPLPTVGDAVALARVKNEKVRKELDEKAFKGELTGKALLAEVPVTKGGGGGKPKPYSLGDIADGAMQTLKRALDSVQAEGDAAWIANANTGKDDVLVAFKAALELIGARNDTRVCWTVWVKK